MYVCVYKHLIKVESYHIFGAARGVAAEGLAGPAAEPGLLGIVPASEAIIIVSLS